MAAGAFQPLVTVGPGQRPGAHEALLQGSFPRLLSVLLIPAVIPLAEHPSSVASLL